MNDIPEQTTGADLPRPRQMPPNPYDFDSNVLPSLKYSAPAPSPVQTQKFSIPEHSKKSSDELPTQKIPVIPDTTPLSPPKLEYAQQSPQKKKSQNPPKKSQKTQTKTTSKKSAASKPKPAPKKKKSSHSSHSGGGFVKKLVRRLVFVLAVIFALYSVIAFLLIRQLEKIPKQERFVTSGSLYEPYVRSVLLIGTDSRDIGAERGRSDTMLLFSLNSRTKQIYLTSFMRDAYVNIPNYGYNKLNAAYSYGGAELLMDTLEQNYQISIDDYCVVSFMGFAGIIDAFGGVEIDLSDEEARALNVILQSEVNALAGDDPLSDFIEKGGTYILNGKQALSYARIRYVGNADFERTSRQREVMTQLLHNAKTRAAAAVPQLISSAMPHLGTNMSDFEMYLLSLRAPVAMAYDITQMQIPADGTFSPADIDGQSVLQVDFDSNIQVLKDSVYASE